MTLRFRLQAIFLYTAVFLLLSVGSAAAEEHKQGVNIQPPAYTISGIKLEQTADDFVLRVHGETPPTYTMYELFEPLRIILDVADASLVDNIELPQNLPIGPVAQVKTQVLDDQEPFIARIEIVLAEDRGYQVERLGNDIVVTFAKELETAAGESSAAALAEKEPAVADNEKKPAVTEHAAPTAQASTLYDIEVEPSPSETRVILHANGPIADYKKAQLKKGSGRPDRMYIDIPNIKMAGQMPPHEVGSALSRVRAAQRGSDVRIVFDSGLDTLFPYTIENMPDGLKVVIKEPSPAATTVIADIIAQKEEQSQDVGAVFTAEQIITSDELIKPVIPIARISLRSAAAEKSASEPAARPEKKKETTKAPGDTFGFAGYEKQKITVDFYKIDLHNVFRLFGEISGLNIVVDEEVNGSLTLALNEVPWDFALDIILNLKDLRKEERFNTIVISPKSKEFLWPKGANQNIAFKADGSIEQVEAISVKQKLQAPMEVMEAKKLIRQAQMKDKAGDYSGALPLYEEAFSQWPENSTLANRLATICLVHLRMNAKAVHFAKAALEINPEDYNAALQAAIGLANMKKIMEAKGYFDLAISGPKPSSEALVSYAAFAEEYKSYNAALALLEKHAELYGDSLETMIARARVYDKLGDSAEAVEEYRSIMLSGYRIPPDLKRYIEGRIAVASN